MMIKNEPGKEQQKTSTSKKIVPYIFVLWIGDIVLTFAIKWVFTGHLSTGPHDTTLLSHQIRMGIRILIAFIMSGVVLTMIKNYTTKDLVLMGAMWLLLLLGFEWGGGIFFAGRSVQDILIGWNIFKGYAWPYVLVGVFVAPILMGQLLRRLRSQDRHSG